MGAQAVSWNILKLTAIQASFDLILSTIYNFSVSSTYSKCDWLFKLSALPLNTKYMIVQVVL